MYDDHTQDDQVTAGAGPGGPGRGAGGVASLLLEVLAPGLHAAPAVRPAGPAPVPQGGLLRAGAAPGGLVRAAPGGRPGQGARPLHPAQGRAAPAGTKGGPALLDATVARPRARGSVRPGSRMNGYSRSWDITAWSTAHPPPGRLGDA